MVTDTTLKITGDLGKILDICIEDSDLMYKNEARDKIRPNVAQNCFNDIQ